MLPQEASSHTGERDRSDKQTRTSQSTEKPGPEFPQLVQLPGTLTPAPRTCPQPLSCPALGLDVSASQSWGRCIDSPILTMIPSYGQLCTPPQESQGLGPKRAVLSCHSQLCGSRWTLNLSEPPFVLVCEVITAPPHPLQGFVGRLKKGKKHRAHCPASEGRTLNLEAPGRVKQRLLVPRTPTK